MNFQTENKHPITAKFSYNNEIHDFKLTVSCMTYPELELFEKEFKASNATADDNVDSLCNVIVGWEDVMLDGEPVEFSKDSLKKFFSTYIGLTDAVYLAIIGEASEIRKKNFTSSDIVGQVQAIKSSTKESKKPQKKSKTDSN